MPYIKMSAWLASVLINTIGTKVLPTLHDQPRFFSQLTATGDKRILITFQIACTNRQVD
jgi:hypothetical protein